MIDYDQLHYIVTFWGLMNAHSRPASTVLRHCEAVYRVVAKHRKVQPDEILSYEELVDRTGLTNADVMTATRFLQRSLASLSTAHTDAKAGVMGGEFFTQHNFKRLKEEMRATYSQNSSAVMLGLYNDSHGPVSVASTYLSSSANPAVRESWNKCLDRLSTDPSGAITAARTLMENVCKFVLDEFGQEHSPTDTLSRLYKRAASCLELAPSQNTEKAYHQMLSGCASMVEGLGRVRNALGDSHGHGKLTARPARRHADIAVCLAASAAAFLLATLDAQRRP